jgi:hypothetical protein
MNMVGAHMTGSAEFARTSVDGVPAFWTHAGGGMAAGLVFRVGRADESLARGGVTHLIEHLRQARPMRWRFFSSEPGSTVKCTCPSSSTATIRTTALA